MSVANGKYKGIRLPKMLTCERSNCGNKVAVTGTSLKSREEFMGYQNHEVVARISEDIKCSLEEAQCIFEDTKRFLYLCAKHRDSVMFPTPMIDVGWHAFILFTKEYAEFCEMYSGGFIHHWPSRKDKPSDPESVISTIDALQEDFPESPSVNWDYEYQLVNA